MITKINHIGIAVNSLDEQIGFYKNVLKLEFLGIEEVPDQKVRAAMFKVGEVHIELLEPIDDDSAIAKFLKKKGEGMHHVAYESDNIISELTEFKKANIKVVDENPRSGTHNMKIAFLHPHSTGRVLTEICQHF
jgi:methylmalonyl-CoA/ethylmalonyl-CoA epimerase